MALERKHLFLIGGSILIVTAIGIGLYLIFKKPTDTKDETQDKPKDKKTGGDDPYPNTEPSSTTPQGNISSNNQSSIQNGMVVPIFNEENELKNDYSQIKGRYLYPKREWQGGWGYTNVRTSPEVNTAQAWYDPFSNLLTTIGEGSPIGKVIDKTTGVYNNYAYTWFKVKLNKPVGFWETSEGYVRADTVTFKPYEK